MTYNVEEVVVQFKGDDFRLSFRSVVGDFAEVKRRIQLIDGAAVREAGKYLETTDDMNNGCLQRTCT